MDLAKLETFVRVAKVGNLSRVALQFGVDTSVISRQLAALEMEFQGRLVHRTGRGVRLTELGERLLPRVQSLLEEAQSLKAEIGEASGVCSGIVRLACLPSVVAPMLIRVVRTMRERHPQVVIHIVEGFSGQVEHWLAEGAVDMGFVLQPSDETDHPIASSRICLVGRAGDRLTLRNSIDFSALDGLPLLMPATGSPYRQVFLQAAEQAGVRLNVVAGVDSLQMQKEMVAAGIGYALVSMSSVLRELKAGELSATRVVNPEVVRSLYLGLSPRKPISPAAREVARLVKQVAHEMTAAGQWVDPMSPVAA